VINLQGPTIPRCPSCDLKSSWDGTAYVCPGCSFRFVDPGSNRGDVGIKTPEIIPSRVEIVDYAKTFLDVPYKHLGRNPDSGIDCIGLLRLIADRFQFSNHDFFNYAPTADGMTLIRELDRAFGVDGGYDASAPPPDRYEHGDVLTFWIRRRTRPKHAGIFVRLEDGREGVLHTYTNVGRVTLHGLNGWWKDRICKVYRWPGVV
jgi:cell wall-associated NlpC family hydrolase